MQQVSGTFGGLGSRVFFVDHICGLSIFPRFFPRFFFFENFTNYSQTSRQSFSSLEINVSHALGNTSGLPGSCSEPLFCATFVLASFFAA